jgi:hypothetical protein
VEILSRAELVLNKFSTGKIVADSWKKLLKKDINDKLLKKW